MQNYVHDGKSIPVVAPYAVSVGVGVLVGLLFGIAAFSAALDEEVEIVTSGIFDITKTADDVVTQGAKIYWDDTAKSATVTATDNTLIGYATIAATGADTTARVKLLL